MDEQLPQDEQAAAFRVAKVGFRERMSPEDVEIWEGIQWTSNVDQRIREFDAGIQRELSEEEKQRIISAGRMIESLVKKMVEAQKSGQGNTEVIYDTRYSDRRADHDTRGIVRNVFGCLEHMDDAEQTQARTATEPAQYEVPTFIPGLTWRVNAREELKMEKDPGITYEAFRFEPNEPEEK